GGNGYVEESLLPRLYRQAPLNSIWEGSGNIQCLDVLRALSREPGSVAALLAELDAAAGGDGDFDAALAALRDILSAGPSDAGAACRSRLGGAHGAAFGSLPADIDFDGPIARAAGG